MPPLFVNQKRGNKPNEIYLINNMAGMNSSHPYYGFLKNKQEGEVVEEDEEGEDKEEEKGKERGERKRRPR